MAITFSFPRVIEAGPIYLELTVVCEYTPADGYCGSSVEYAELEVSEEVTGAIPGLWAPMRKWIEETYSAAFEKEGEEHAVKQGLFKYDRPWTRSTGLAAHGYAW